MIPSFSQRNKQLYDVQEILTAFERNITNKNNELTAEWQKASLALRFVNNPQL